MPYPVQSYQRNCRHPAVMQRRSATAYLGVSALDVAAAIPGPTQPFAAAASSLTSFIGAITGSSHRFAGTAYEGAEQARADAGAMGAAGGSVQAARYLLAQQKTDTSPYAQQATKAAIQQATMANPTVMQQAQSTPLTDQDHDQPDGTGVLGILYQLKFPLTDAYAGYSTNTGGPGSETAMQLAAALRQLPPIGSGPLPAVSTVPGSSGLPLNIQAPAPVNPVTGLANAVSLTAAQINAVAQKIASGALSLSQLGTLASGDLQLIQAQADAIKAGTTPPGALSVFVQNNKLLVYGGGAIVGVVVLKKLRVL